MTTHINKRGFLRSEKPWIFPFFAHILVNSVRFSSIFQTNTPMIIIYYQYDVHGFSMENEGAFYGYTHTHIHTYIHTYNIRWIIVRFSFLCSGNAFLNALMRSCARCVALIHTSYNYFLGLSIILWSRAHVSPVMLCVLYAPTAYTKALVWSPFISDDWWPSGQGVRLVYGRSWVRFPRRSTSLLFSSWDVHRRLLMLVCISSIVAHWVGKLFKSYLINYIQFPL